jgi:hypothetical protein
MAAPVATMDRIRARTAIRDLRGARIDLTSSSCGDLEQW